MTQVNDPSEQRAYRVAVVGSSGGNLRSHGGDDPSALLDEVRRQLDAAGVELAAVQFVAAAGSMDTARDQTSAALWQLVSGVPAPTHEGDLATVNDAARSADRDLAAAVRAGDLHGLVLVSNDRIWYGADVSLSRAAAKPAATKPAAKAAAPRPR